MQPTGTRPTEIVLGNDLDIRLEEARVRGAIDEGLSLRGYLAAGEEDTAALDPSLEAAAVAVGDGSGDYIAALSGAALSAVLSVGNTVWVVGESVPPGAYRDAFAVRVAASSGGGGA